MHSRALIAPAALLSLAGCSLSAAPTNDAPSTSVDGAQPASSTPAIGKAAQPLRTHEGRAAQLRALAREVSVDRPAFAALALTAAPGEATADAGPPAPEPPLAEPSDAGASEGNEPSEPEPGEPSEPASDAGAPPPVAPPPVPQPLPRDIVEQSALPIYGLEAGVVLTEEQLWDRLAESPAVCFGEYHDVPAHHYAETRALDALAARAKDDCRPFAVGYEMWQRPWQAPLSAFVAGELGEEDFLAQTEYATRWGYDFSFYRPLLELTRDNGLPALALNMQREITRKIGRTGLESLTEEELAILPELDLTDEEHRTFIFGLFGVLPEHAAEFGLENVYVAQTVWDETMADTSARWLTSEGRRARLLDFAGGVHCHQSAIPRRISRRTGEPALAVHAVFESELTEGSFTPEGYDVLVVLDDSTD